jgi:hypothetical protein
MNTAGRLSRAGLLWLAAAGCASASGLAGQHRQIDSVQTRPAHGATAALGGPKPYSSTGPRFPVLPAGALATRSTPAAAHRPMAPKAMPIGVYGPLSTSARHPVPAAHFARGVHRELARPPAAASPRRPVSARKPSPEKAATLHAP